MKSTTASKQSLRVLLIVGLLAALSACGTDLQAGWWDSVSDNTKTDARNDAILSGVSETKGQIEKFGNKHFTASQMRKTVAGNASVRGRSAQKLNAISEYFSELSNTGAMKALGVTAFIADGPAAFAGHISVGDFAGGMKVVTTETLEAASAAGGAASLGWLGLTVGTSLGGPPGGAVGGAVGSVLGGILGASGFTLVASDDVGNLAEYIFTSKEIDPRLQARLARADYFRQNAAEKEMKAIGWEDSSEKEAVIVDSSMSMPKDFLENMNKEPETPKLRAAPSSNSSSSRPSAPVENIQEERKRSKSTPEERRKLRKDLLKKADRMAARGEGPSQDGYGATPVIPENATIDTVVWQQDYPEHKTNLTWYLNSGNFYTDFTHTTEEMTSGNEHYSNICYASKYRYESTGSLQGNIIQSTGKFWSETPHRCVTNSYTTKRQGETSIKIPYTCDNTTAFTGSSTETIYLNIDGTLTIDSIWTTFPEYNVTGNNCPYDAEPQRKAWRESNMTGAQPQHTIGIWQFRK